MENASKALLIAGSMLIIILVLSFAAMLFRNTGADTANIYEQMSDTDISEYNQKFMNYQGKDIKIQDVVSIINLAKYYNEIGKIPVTISVNMGGRNLLDANIEDLLKDNLEKKYECTVNFEPNTRYIGNIVISQK